MTKQDDLNQRIAALSPAQRAIFEQMKQQKSIAPQAQKPIDRLLSFAQERLWFLHQFDPNNPAYNIAIAWNFTGSIDASLLEKSLNAIVQRHESLRTAFTETAGKPKLEIAARRQLSLPVIDLRSLPESMRQQESDRLAKQIASTPFDLSKAPLLRAVLLQLDRDRSTLILTLHHIIADGWSRGILLKEFAAFYREFATGKLASLSPLSIQYADFAIQQRQQLQGNELNQHLAYWKQQLANLTPIELPSDRSHPAVPTYRSEQRSLLLPRSLLAALKQISRQAGTTLFMTLLTAFKVLLHRYCDQDDIAIGIPVANRNSIETEKLIGFFVNTIVLRSNLAGNPQFQELLGEVKAIAAAAYQHQELPFAKLVEELHPQRSLSQNSLFQVMFQLQNEAYQLQNSLTPELEIPGIVLSQTWIETGYTKFDLTWHLVERAEGLLAVAEFSTDLFDGESIDRMLQHFQVLLTGITDDPTQRISELPLLTTAEQKQLTGWNSTKTSIEFLPVHRQFEAEAARSPEKIAVQFQEEKLTYRSLNAKANQLAHYLQSQGVQPEIIVGVHLERSPLLLIALLAILKAGAAYLPLDPQLPIDRLNFIVQDAGVAIVLGKPLQNARAIDLENWSEIDRFPESDPQQTIEPSSLAYVIYTSGSTGKPKGAMLAHAGFSNYLEWCIKSYFSIEGSGAPVQSSIGFDATITSLFAPLLTGRTVTLLPEFEEISALENLLQTDKHFSFVKLTPAYLKLLQSTNSSTPVLVIGGEALTGDHLSSWRSTSTKLINEYGPTEATVGCCVYEIPPQSAGNIPIGRPIPNMQLYILDRYLQPVPIGVPGELFISGIGLARGYLDRPDLTAERFIPNPFTPRTRLYKTGDRARYLPDGNIEYLGRLDHQIKLRGYRIELGEIEAALCQNPQVKTAVVTVQNDRLIACIVLSTLEIESSQLRQFLQAKLPSYMIPNAFVYLEKLSLTPNGKIDREALPEWTPALPKFQSGDRSLPQSPIEQQLTEIWQQVLNLPEIGIYDNFFELGGDSILSLQIVYRANQAGLQLTPRQIFQHQTIAELAQVAGLRSSISTTQESITGTAPLTPIQHWFFEWPRSNPHHFNQTVLLEVESVQPQLIAQTLQQLSQHHDALRLRFEQTDSGWQQFHAAVDETIAFHVVDLSSLSPDIQAKAIKTTATALQASLNLSKLPWRVVLFRFGEQHARLLFVVHHLLIDGVSWQILLEDFVTVYQQLQQNQPVQLPPKTTAFRDWSQQLTRYAESEDLAKEFAYWQAMRSTPIPINFSVELAQNTVASVAEVQFALDIDRTQALRTEVLQAYHTQINDVLLTALLQSFTQWTEVQQLRIDLESHGREDLFDLDLSRSIGWFTSLFPAVLLLNERQPEALLKSVKEQLRHIPNGGIGYGMLRYLSSKQLEIPSADLKFNYLGQIDRLSLKSPLIGLAKEFCGSPYAMQEQRRYLIEINGWITANQLHFRWTYSRNFHKAETIEKLSQHFIFALQNLIDRCQSTTAGGYTPSDFPAARLDQKQLDQLIGKLHGKR